MHPVSRPRPTNAAVLTIMLSLGVAMTVGCGVGVLQSPGEEIETPDHERAGAQRVEALDPRDDGADVVFDLADLDPSDDLTDAGASEEADSDVPSVWPGTTACPHDDDWGRLKSPQSAERASQEQWTAWDAGPPPAVLPTPFIPAGPIPSNLYESAELTDVETVLENALYRTSYEMGNNGTGGRTVPYYVYRGTLTFADVADPGSTEQRHVFVALPEAGFTAEERVESADRIFRMFTLLPPEVLTRIGSSSSFADYVEVQTGAARATITRSQAANVPGLPSYSKGILVTESQAKVGEENLYAASSGLTFLVPGYLLGVSVHEMTHNTAADAGTGQSGETLITTYERAFAYSHEYSAEVGRILLAALLASHPTAQLQRSYVHLRTLACSFPRHMDAILRADDWAWASRYLDPIDCAEFVGTHRVIWGHYQDASDLSSTRPIYEQKLDPDTGLPLTATCITISEIKPSPSEAPRADLVVAQTRADGKLLCTPVCPAGTIARRGSYWTFTPSYETHPAYPSEPGEFGQDVCVPRRKCAAIGGRHPDTGESFDYCPMMSGGRHNVTFYDGIQDSCHYSSEERGFTFEDKCFQLHGDFAVILDPTDFGPAGGYGAWDLDETVTLTGPNPWGSKHCPSTLAEQKTVHMRAHLPRCLSKLQCVTPWDPANGDYGWGGRIDGRRCVR